MNTKNLRKALICGMLGCLCYGGGDWLMMYGNPAYHGTLSWLTEGVAMIPQWRFNLAMALAFPGDPALRDRVVCRAGIHYR